METITVNEVKTTHSTDMIGAATASTIAAASEPRLPQHPESEFGSPSKLRLLGKALRMFVKQGPAFAVRRAIWRYYFERFERQRKALSEGGKAAPVIHFLGHDFELHRSNEGVTEEMRLYGVHEPSATEDYLAQLSEGDHIIDVGSNLGYYLLLAAQKIGKKGRILGFEPAPGVFEVLERNIRQSGLPNVQVAPWAMSNKNGTLEFYESEIPNWGSFFQDSRLQQTRVTPVQCKTIDDVILNTPDFRPTALRMDVEGAELMVLEGAREVLRRYRPCLFIEFHNFAIGWDAMRGALRQFESFGYSSGVLIERTWDQPWMPKWMRDRRRWSGSISTLIKRIESKKNPLTESTLIVVLTAPRGRS